MPALAAGVEIACPDGTFGACLTARRPFGSHVEHAAVVGTVAGGTKALAPAQASMSGMLDAAGPAATTAAAAVTSDSVRQWITFAMYGASAA